MSLLIFVGGMACGVFPLFIGAVPQESVRPELSAQATAFVMGCGQFGGGVFGPVIIGVAADSFGLQAPLIAAAALALIGAFICLHLRETAPGLAVERG